MGRFYENFEQICKTKGRSPSSVVLEIGRSKNAASNWKINGTIPKQDELEDLADVLGCTVADFFKDEETRENDQFNQLLSKKLSDVDEDSVERGKQILYYLFTLESKSPYTDKQKELWDRYQRALGDFPKRKGNGNAEEEPLEIEVVPDDVPTLDDYERDFIRIYESLDAKTRIKLMNAVYEFDVEGDQK